MIKYLLVLNVEIECYIILNGNEDKLGIDYHEICICDECVAELWSEPQYDDTVKLVETPEE